MKGRNARVLVAAVVVALAAASLLLLRGGDETKTLTAHFPRAVSIYEGSDVRILGVNVGRVTAVIPEGNSVRVEMQYDAAYKLPADAKAVIVTPTLVADRFVQLTPAWSEGDRLMADGADIALPDTGVPVELDRIYASLRDLSEALGPNGVNKDGTLNHVLEAGAKNLAGQGRLGNKMLRNLAAAATTFGQGSGDLFATVTQLAKFSQVLGNNDRLVRAFIRDLAGVSGSLVTERVQLQRALSSVATAVGTVKGFVHDNRKALVTDLEKLTRVMQTINSEKGSIDDALQVAPLALGNLAVAFNNSSGSIGSRIGVNGTFGDLDGFLCSIVMQSGMPKASKDLACRIFKQIEPAEDQTSKSQTSGPSVLSTTQRDQAAAQQYVAGSGSSLSTLIGGGR
ncbi:phospholipid/cholesterol/gamma-HCH transport system substrate-binding protein [Nocardioides ginsengisegetis]|uniref:Phospholipid/cholesterol/gamma-HCH transport system substrate-binding protein n=1 Tax=Nocardioides ginsengisegetis TaxID=661491 RepID=A0A7W3IZW5_9ACTN|nr:MCE family protein [Nocardioides ginsengisegetis]MBA8803721.1 phospholipid/cholesterol/gamma-HCH transport system substrate-binding protein [Nocardioides ginsengisegetis]